MANIIEKIGEARLIWLGHVEKKTGKGVVEGLGNETIAVGLYRKIGRPKLSWSDVIRKNTKEKNVKIEEAQDRRTCGD